MNLTFVPRLLLPFVLFVASGAVCAQVDSQPLGDAERKERLQRASQLQAEASRLQREADARLKAANAACHQKFLVSSCLEDAKRAHTRESRIATRLDQEGGEIERDIKRRDVAAKQAQRARDMPKHEADQAAQGEAYRAEEARRAEARAAKLEKKEQQAAAGRKKHAADQAKHQKKLEAQAKKEAKAAEKRRAREAKESRKGSAKRDGAE